MLTERQEKILNLIIEEYNRFRKPIGSKWFARKYFKELSSATIRREFNFLTKQKYLAQPYWSAGRIPTDKAYQWFVETNILNPFLLENDVAYWEKKLEKLHDLPFFEMTKQIANLCESLTVGYLPPEEMIFKFGLKKLFEQLKELSLMRWETIWEDLDYLDDRLKKSVRDLIQEDMQIFIGDESPITKDKHLSVVSYAIPQKTHKNLLILIGPKNMICRRNISILEAAHKILNQ
ncbi:MAG: hypothetical protein N2692_02540 [Patescibacteria group bacterium]|jgi:transcriptional regulator of heat shock response|nr:hypothetical protein [Patescibacteria group bacterium]